MARLPTLIVCGLVARHGVLGQMSMIVEAPMLIPIVLSAEAEPSAMEAIEEQAKKIRSPKVNELPAPEKLLWDKMTGCWEGTSRTDGGIAFPASSPGMYTTAPEDCCTSIPIVGNTTMKVFATPEGRAAIEFFTALNRVHIRPGIGTTNGVTTDRVFDFNPMSTNVDEKIKLHAGFALRNVTAESGYFQGVFSISDMLFANADLSGMSSMLLLDPPQIGRTSLKCFYIKISEDGNSMDFVSTGWYMYTMTGRSDLMAGQAWVCPDDYKSWSNLPAAVVQEPNCVEGCMMSTAYPMVNENQRITETLSFKKKTDEPCFTESILRPMLEGGDGYLPNTVVSVGITDGSGGILIGSVNGAPQDVVLSTTSAPESTTAVAAVPAAEADDDFPVVAAGGAATGVVLFLGVGIVVALVWRKRVAKKAESKGGASELDGSMAETGISDLQDGHIDDLVEKGVAEHWLLPWKSIEVKGEPLPPGTFGTVQRCSLLGSTEIALKISRVPETTTTEEFEAKFRSFIMEARVYRHIRHPNLVLFHGITVQDTGDRFFGIALEWLQGSDMAEYVRNRHESGQITRDITFVQDGDHARLKETKVAHDIIRAMLYLHGQEPPIAHNALKPKNILIEDVDPPLAKVTDIRKSPLSLSSNVPADVAATARCYVAPEILNGQKSDHMNDVYSFGCLILFMLTGQTPPESKDGSAARGALQKLAESDHAVEALLEVAGACLVEKPELRPAFTQVFQMLDPHSAKRPKPATATSSMASPNTSQKGKKTTKETLMSTPTSPPGTGSSPNQSTPIGSGSQNLPNTSPIQSNSLPSSANN